MGGGSSLFCGVERANFMAYVSDSSPFSASVVGGYNIGSRARVSAISGASYKGVGKRGVLP